jgi:hypothetical protein
VSRHRNGKLSVQVQSKPVERVSEGTLTVGRGKPKTV